MYVEVKNLNKKFGSYRASKNISFEIERGKLIGLLGPSGSGKTTILRIIAGLETADSGEIYIDGKLVNNISPGKRGIGFVFQNYALFRNMTVYENIAFGLSIKKADKGYIKQRVTELIELIGLKGLEKRYPSQLSGGQKQRVAFARAIAPKPQLLLLDEPFAAIDAKVRKELRTWLKQMIHKLGITSIFVTHDQEEAVEVADEIIITNLGSIEQIGSAVEIYKNPKTAFVAKFVGESNIIENFSEFKAFKQLPDGSEAIVRPEFVEIGRKGEMQCELVCDKGVVVDISFAGSNWIVTVKVGDAEVSGIRSLEKDNLHIGEEVVVLVHRLYLFKDNKVEIIENNVKSDVVSAYI
ncbi:sulfate/molybdate ABC transporter ATP-binding protein [Clostridium luticellarii]|jgi:sulfate transport system ATP-binding protein|uniref:sulfate/molybdate ABC transporter ATP-binding protein n=1 Tax=Clostridium luticellarii TaxID=1691940 RepID=UPI0023539659|nr:ABC transporter ATP-binding protein [Clostridium luticellarii]MCI1945347.1 ABC transporter ATP-binding protein [Clostridium luticellarii]MCI1968688.1 ABC transporter ATP-binding protein [Clostridium luticellarii]MCI1996148.1 ABC transporter ATP-binding protein [Clostridium luticellarii]MCI2040396.1 ABC transporter ATP-binding protein [Clostridium luticellarii]